MTTESMTLREHLEAEFRTSLTICREERQDCLHESDTDAVHDTRVASRRVLETMRMFEHVLQPKAVASLRKALRGWMRRSGKVRDLDVSMDLVRDSGVTGCERLMIAMQRRREQAVERALQYLGKPVPWPSKKSIGKWWKEPRRSEPEVLWDLDSSSADNGAMVLPWLLHRYTLRGDRLLEGEPRDEEFHLFRLRTKRFRYTTEWFAPMMPERVGKALVPALKGFQQSLGAFQDAVAAAELLDEPEFRQELDEGRTAQLRVFLQRHGDEAKQRFLARWREFRRDFVWHEGRERARVSRVETPYRDANDRPRANATAAGAAT
jgi:triphosphatase